MYQVRYRKAAVKGLSKMPDVARARMVTELDAMAIDPGAYRGDWKRLRGSPYWRLRVGSWRAICSLREIELVILVLKIGASGDVYK